MLAVRIAVAAICGSMLFARTAAAAVSTTGNVTPNPTTTTSSTDLLVGNTNAGTMLVDGGSTVLSSVGHIAENIGVSGSVTVTGSLSKWTNSQELSVGEYGQGTLNILAGGFVSCDDAYIAHNSISAQPPPTGAVTVDGANSIWSISGELTIARLGTGTLDITNGGLVLNQGARVGVGATGTVNVSGAGSTWDSSGDLEVGDGMPGTVNVTNGGYVENQNGAIGSSSGGVGIATVDGVGSSWKSISTLTVGEFGDGTLHITNGGVVNSPSATIGNIFAGTVGHAFVDGAGSTWNASLKVGDSALGFLEVTGGGKVVGTNGYIGYLSGTGTVTIDGVGSSWSNSNALYVARKGTGTLNVAGGATVYNSSYSYIGADTGSVGIANVDGAGSKWSTNSAMYVGDNGNGTLNISNGGSVEAALSTYVSRGSGTGTIAFDGGTLTTNLLLAPAVRLVGTGVVNTHGLVTDIDLLFDQSHGAQQQITLNALPAQNVTINLDLNSDVPIGVGYAAQGSLTVSEGKAISSGAGYFGYKAGSNGAGIVTGAGSVWSSMDDLVYVGHGGQGSLQIVQGGRVNSLGADIGNLPASSGAATVDGANSLWASFWVVVGRNGAGTLAITNGGRVTTSMLSAIGSEAGAVGEVTVDGPTSTWDGGSVRIGERGSGKLKVMGGADVTSLDVRLGNFAGSTGEVSVSGTGSTWTARDVTIGVLGSGTLKILNGAAVYAESVLLAISTGTGSIVFDNGTLATDSLYTSPGALSGAGGISAHGIVSDFNLVFDSTHTAQQQIVFNSLPGQNVTLDLDANALGDLGAGYAAAGSLAISDGRVISSASGMLGFKSGSTGLATVDGAGSTWNVAQPMAVGAGGSGAMTVSNGGTLNLGTSSLSAALYIGSSATIPGGAGIVNINSGGKVDVYGDVVLGNSLGSSGTVNLTNGTLRMHGAQLRKGSSGSATLNFTGGLLEGATTINLGTTFVQSGGTFAPGNGVGTTTITGGYTLDAGTLNIQLNDTGAPGFSWDLVKVTGAVNLLGANGVADGVLNVALNFAPAANSSYLIIENDGSDAVVNRFVNGTSIRSLFNNKLYQFTISYASGAGSNDISLTNTTISVQGDYNNNGKVDAADYVLWRNSLSATVAPFFGADGDGDGTVDNDDYAVWRSQFGMTPSSGVGVGESLDAAPVPEPASVMLVGFLALFGLVVRSRHAGQSL